MLLLDSDSICSELFKLSCDLLVSLRLHFLSKLLLHVDVQDRVRVWLYCLGTKLSQMAFYDFRLNVFSLVPSHYVVLCSTTDCVVLESERENQILLI